MVSIWVDADACPGVIKEILFRAARRTGTTSRRLRGARLGAGITTVPSAPVSDPKSAIMVNPEVPEERRF